MKNGIFFLTYDGYYNYTSGIGTQTKTFLKGIEKYYNKYSKIFGEFEVNLIVPNFDKTVYGYNKNDIEYADKIINKLGGKIYKCVSSIDKEGTNFWTTKNWAKVSASAASIISKQSIKYKRCIVITTDPPFLFTAKYFMDDYKNKHDIQFLILMYTSAYIHDKTISKSRYKWERNGLLTASKYRNVKIGNVCKYMNEHLIKSYNINPNLFVPYPSSLFIEDTDFNILSESKIKTILNKYNIPTNKDIIFSFGRASWVKGFDTLLKSYNLVKNNIYLVILATQFIEDELKKYKKIINNENISCSLLTNFSRELPSALCQYKRCKVVVCPSRREPFSNIPLEVGLWAKKQGPIVLASNIGDFIEQINDGENGYLFNVDDCRDLSIKIDEILYLSDNQLKNIRLNAYNKVIKERDFYKNFRLFLEYSWGK